MKKFTICTLIVSVLLMSFSMCSFASDFTVAGNVDFDSSDLTVTIKTPATYEQNILVTVYKENDTLTVPTQYVRMGQTRANKKGDAKIVFNLATLEKGRYTISATGGGKLAGSSHDTFSLYFETADETNNVTIPSLSTSVDADLQALAARLESDYLLDMGDGYSGDEEKFLSLFETIRADEFNNNYSAMGDVQKTLDGVNLIMTTLSDVYAKDLQALYEMRRTELSLFDNSDADYKANNEGVYPILKVIAKDKEADLENLNDIREIFFLAQGLATINTKDSGNVTEYVLRYGEKLGIDVEEYKEYCDKYGEIETNLDLVGRNFTKPGQFVQAFEDSKAVLDATPSGDGNSGSSGGSSGGSGGGGGGGFSGGSSSDKLKGEGTTITDLPTPTEPALPEVSFNDIDDNHWANDYVIKLAQYNVIAGFEDGTFRPEALVTKEQFVKMVVEAFGIKSDKKTSAFADVDAGHWAAGYIAIAVDKGLINGKSESEFGIGENLARQDAAVIITRVADLAGYTLQTGKSEAFSDKADIAAYALDGVTRLSNAGIINGMGDGTFAPQGTLTRAQAAKILYMMIVNK